jgi:hypothetical protein
MCGGKASGRRPGAPTSIVFSSFAAPDVGDAAQPKWMKGLRRGIVFIHEFEFVLSKTEVS